MTLKATSLVFFALVSYVAAFSVGEWVCVQPGENKRDSACGNVLGTTNGNERGIVKAITSPSCSMGNYTWVQIAMDDSGPVFWVADIGYIYDCGIPSGSTVINGVPYINQRWDTGDSFDGSWACGPTSTLMAMAYFKKVTSKPVSTSSPWVHNNDYGWYDYSVYTSPTGYVFDTMDLDAAGQPAYGAYGLCTIDGAAWAYRIQDYIQDHGGMSAPFYDTATPDLVAGFIKQGQPVVLSTQLSSAGHLVLVVGMTPDGNWIVNDPWGNANQPNWGMYPNGAYVTYTWAKMQTKWMVAVVPGSFETVPAPRNVFTNVTGILKYKWN
jgi:hypothetical protein